MSADEWTCEGCGFTGSTLDMGWHWKDCARREPLLTATCAIDSNHSLCPALRTEQEAIWERWRAEVRSGRIQWSMGQMAAIKRVIDGDRRG